MTIGLGTGLTAIGCGEYITVELGEWLIIGDGYDAYTGREFGAVGGR